MNDPTKPGPRALPVVYTCTGCPALRLGPWSVSYAGRRAYCAETADKRLVNSDWRDNSPAPDWCPHKEST